MSETPSVETLAAELKQQSVALRRSVTTANKHYRECDKRSLLTVQRLKEGSEKMDGLAGSLAAIEKRFETFDRVTRWASRYGKWLAGTVVAAFIGAFTSLYAQSYYQHQQVQQTATVAATSAAQTAKGQAVVIHKLDQLVPDP
jgi:hypothetical protein